MSLGLALVPLVERDLAASGEASSSSANTQTEAVTQMANHLKDWFSKVLFRVFFSFILFLSG